VTKKEPVASVAVARTVTMKAPTKANQHAARCSGLSCGHTQARTQAQHTSTHTHARVATKVFGFGVKIGMYDHN